MASQALRGSSGDDSKETLDWSGNDSTSNLQTAAIVAKANELGPINVSGTRARKPPTRLVDEIALQNNSVGATIEDPEDLTSEKDDHEAGDTDYKESSIEQKPQFTSNIMDGHAQLYAHGLSPDWEVKYHQAWREMHILKTSTSTLRKKRTEDRKLGAIEKANRIRLEKEVKDLMVDRAKLRDDLIRAKEPFEERLEQQQNDFNKAQAAMTKLLQKDETFTITDDIVRDSLQGLKSEWKSWAKKYSNSTFQDCPEARIRELITKTALNKSMAQQDHIFQMLAAKSSGSVICVNALLAFDVCEKTFGEAFLSLLALEGGHEFKKMSTKFVCTTMKDLHKTNLWRAQTLQLAELHGWDPSQKDLPAHLIHREAILQQHYGSLSSNFLNQVADGMLKRLTNAEAAKRENELHSMYREAGKLSIRLWKQTTHLHVDIAGALRDKFSRRSNTMQPHSSMLLDEDDTSCDGKLVDMVIEPGLVAYGDAYGQNYDMKKNWMKATVLLFDQPLEEYLKTPHQADALKLTASVTQKTSKHQIKFEDDENETQIKRTKKTVPSMGFGDNVSGEVQQSAAITQSTPSSNAPQSKPLSADAKAVSRSTSKSDVRRPNERIRDQRTPTVAQKPSKAEPAKQSAGSKPENHKQQTTTTSNKPRAPLPASLKATMGGQATIPEMTFFSKTLEGIGRPAKRNDTWEIQETSDAEAKFIQLEAHKSAIKRAASMTPASQKKPAGLYHENATTAGSTGPEELRANGARNNKEMTVIKVDD